MNTNAIDIKRTDTNGTKTKTTRNMGLDLVRCCAIFFVICVHFFLNSGYYDAPMVGKKMFLMTALRWLFFTCVPLFMILSGFLMRNKTLCKQYYTRLIRILYEYIIISIICNIFKIFILDGENSIKMWISSILGFYAAPYSWYVNMYIGLCLIIPFLNILYKGLKTQNQKRILILTMLLITSVPWFSNMLFQVLPNWWTQMYPITYYFIGAYIAEYKIKLNRLACIGGIFIVIISEAAITYILSRSGPFCAVLDDFGALPTAILSIFVFLLLYTVNISGNVFKKLLISISKCSLSIYLISWIFDTVFYKVLNEKFALIQEKIVYFIVIVPAVFISSYIIALIVTSSYNYLMILHNRLTVPLK